MRAYMPSPPIALLPQVRAACGVADHTLTDEPLSCAPALAPGAAELAKLPVMSPE